MTAPQITLQRVPTNGTEINVATAGSGPALLLLHGFPHTWRVWSQVIPQLATTHRVIAPDLRGLGASRRETDGYDLHTLAADAVGLLDALGEDQADVMGIDAGTPPAFMLAMRAPGRVRRLVLMESLLGALPGGEGFLAGGPPWWFSFHSAPGLAETVLIGHEGEYVDWFLRSGTADGGGVDADVRDAFVEAHTGTEALRAAFASYRTAPVNSQQIVAAAGAGRLTVPTMAIGARPIGNTLHEQLRPITDDLTGHVLEDCGHIIPLDRPDALLTLIEPFLAVQDAS